MTSEYIASDDAECIYDGVCTVKNYGASTNKEPFIGFTDLDITQFDHILNNVKPSTEMQCIIALDDSIVLSESMKFQSAYDSSSGKWIKLSFIASQDITDWARENTGKSFSLYLISGQIAKSPKKNKGEHGKYASKLLMSQLMINRGFWSIVGTEENYLNWVRSQKCMISGSQVETESGEMRVEAAHVRDIKYGAGIAKKPEYFAIPLHPEVHAKQHEKGIYNMWQSAGRPTPSSIQYPIHSKEDHIRQWLVIETLKYIKLWIKKEISDYFNVDSLSHVSEEMFIQYINDKCGDQDCIDCMLDLSRKKQSLEFLVE